MKGCWVRPLNILHLPDTREIGGPGKTILETYRAIDPSRFEMHLGIFLRHGEPENSPFIIEATRIGMPLWRRSRSYLLA